MNLWYAAMPVTLLLCGWFLYMQEREHEGPGQAMKVVLWCVACTVGLMVLSAPLFLLLP